MRLRSLLFACFFVSGISGLIYEVVWTRMLTVLFGNTVFAVSTVLAAFMAGLALGSFTFGRTADRYRDLLRLYVWLEAGIGIVALLFPLVLKGFDPLYIWIYRHAYGGFAFARLVQFALAFTILLVPTTLMGATLPVMSRILTGEWSRFGRDIGMLYSLNTFGAVAGCFTAGFLLIGSLGMRETSFVAAAMNLGIAAVLRWLVSKQEVTGQGDKETRRQGDGGTRGQGDEGTRRRGDKETRGQGDRGTRGQGDKGTGRRGRRMILWAFALSGCAALAYEVIWTRALVFFVGNSTYAFTTMLTTFLIGLSLGSLLAARFTDRWNDLLALFGALEIAIGITAVLTIPVVGRIFYRVGVGWEAFNNVYWGNPVYFQFLKCFIVMLLPTVLMGATFPVVSKLYTGGDLRRVGRHIGGIYAANTVGAIIGSLLAGFVLIPLIGLQRSAILIASINLVIGGGLLALSPSIDRFLNRFLKGCVFTGVAAAVMVGNVVPPFDMQLKNPEIREKEVVYYREGTSGIVRVFQEATTENRWISIDGWPVAGTGNHRAISLPEIQKMLGHLPMLLHRDPRSALVIGFGAGGTSWAISRYDVERIDCVELVPEVIGAAGYFPEVNHGVVNDPRFTVFYDDGRSYLLVTDRMYDVISVDAIDPKHAGSGYLYAEEFYTSCREHLNPGGVMVQWLPYHQIPLAGLKMIIKTFRTVFPHATLWFTRYRSYTILVGTTERLTVDVVRLKERLQDEGVQEDVKEIALTDPFVFLGCFAMREEKLGEFVRNVRTMNTYNHPWIEFFGLEWHSPSVENLSAIGASLESILPLLSNVGDFAAVDDVLRRHVEASKHFLLGRMTGSREEFRRALELLPGDEGIKYELKTSALHKKAAMEALARQPNDPQAHSDLGYIYWSEGDYDRALPYLKKVVELEPGSARAHLRLGAGYEAKEWYDKAIAMYQKSLTLQPTPAEIELARRALEIVSHKSSR